MGGPLNAPPSPRARAGLGSCIKSGAHLGNISSGPRQLEVAAQAITTGTGGFGTPPARSSESLLRPPAPAADDRQAQAEGAGAGNRIRAGGKRDQALARIHHQGTR